MKLKRIKRCLFIVLVSIISIHFFNCSEKIIFPNNDLPESYLAE